MRVFVAVGVPLPGLGPGGGSADAPTHLTLAFLGDVADDRVPELIDRLRPAAGSVGPFDLVARGVGAFPSPDRPRVVWVGVGDGADALRRLAEAVRRALGEGRFAFDPKPFVPHITVLRVRRPPDRALAASLLAHDATVPLGQRRVDDLEVVESRLGRTGAVHTAIARLPLGPPPG